MTELQNLPTQLARRPTPCGVTWYSHGVTHRYAPLAVINVGDVGVTLVSDCRTKFEPLAVKNP
jgi:hypothetical protein